MLRFVARRLLLIPLTLLLLSVLVFVLVQYLPGDIGRTILGPDASAEQVARLNHELGLDQPVLDRYLRFAGGLVTGDWGTSALYNTEIKPLIFERLANSATLAALAFVVMVPLGLGLGLLSALREGTFLDRLISVGTVTALGIPIFVSAVLLILVFGVTLGWLPVSATAPAGSGLGIQLRYLVLPVIPIVLAMVGHVARHVRGEAVQALRSDYVRTATLKGLPRGQVVRRHVLPNSLIPAVTVVGVQVGQMLGGLVVIEMLFNYPGLGKLVLDGAQAHDVPLLATGAMVTAALFMVATLLADVVYGLLDPRIRRS